MEIVNVPVPIDRLQEVYAVLGRVNTRESVEKPAETATQLDLNVPLREVKGADTWDPEDFQDLWNGSEDAVKQVFAYLAERPDEEVPLERLLLDLDQEGRALGGVLGALQRRSRNHFEREMPIQRRRRRGVNHYVLSHDVAKWVRDLQGKAG